LGPARFWLGVAVALIVVGGIAYTYGAWYASVLTMDAVAVREIQQRASWPGRFQYSDEGSGLRVRVRRSAPDTFDPRFSLDYLDAVDIASGGYSSYGEAQRIMEMRIEEEDEEEEEEEQQGMDRSEYLRAMRETGLLTGEEQARGRNHTVVVDEFGSQGDARAAAQRLRSLGRPVELQEVRGEDGTVSYRLQSGSFPTLQEAEAYQQELEQAGLIGGSSSGGSTTETTEPQPPSGAGSSEGPGGGETTPPTGGGTDGSSGGTDPVPRPGPEDLAPPTDPGPSGPAGGSNATPPPADPIPPPPSDPLPPPGGGGGGRALGDL
jgi:hypothetical protein